MSGKIFSIESLRDWINSYEEDKLFQREWLYRIKRSLRKFSIWLGFHAAIRYFPLVRHIRNSGVKNPSILEVGSGPIGITNYLKTKVIGLDINPRALKMSTLQLVKGPADCLPFGDAKFDFTVSVDFLEHIPGLNRKDAIAEMIRVTKEDILIGVPCGEKAREWEKKVKNIYRKKVDLWHKKSTKRENFIKQKAKFLSEHEEMGLPDEDKVIESINEGLAQTKDRYSIGIIDNESLRVWYWYVLAELRYNYIRWFITTILALFLLPLLKRIRWGGCYRKIFIIKKVD